MGGGRKGGCSFSPECTCAASGSGPGPPPGGPGRSGRRCRARSAQPPSCPCRRLGGSSLFLRWASWVWGGGVSFLRAQALQGCGSARPAPGWRLGGYIGPTLGTAALGSGQGIKPKRVRACVIPLVPQTRPRQPRGLPTRVVLGCSRHQAPPFPAGDGAQRPSSDRPSADSGPAPGWAPGGACVQGRVDAGPGDWKVEQVLSWQWGQRRVTGRGGLSRRAQHTAGQSVDSRAGRHTGGSGSGSGSGGRVGRRCPRSVPAPGVTALPGEGVLAALGGDGKG